MCDCVAVSIAMDVAQYIDELGVGFIEGGWPGANPKDTEFFRRARTELSLKHAQLAAFGATRRANVRVEDDHLVRALLDAETPVVTLVAKSHTGHVERALKTTLEENLAMIRDTVSFLARQGRRVFLDAEHFFDGYRRDPAYALEVVRTAADAGAELAALCDTNGGLLPDDVGEIVAAVADTAGVRLGIHCHNDTGCAVANSLAAVDAGATHVQGTLNGYGERTGNADLVSVVANLQLKRGRTVVPEDTLREATRIAHAVSEVTNIVPYSRQPYVGASAFHTQGRPARQCDQGRPRSVPARRPISRRQRHADARVRHGRARQHRTERTRARLRAVPGPRAGQPGDSAGEGPRVPGLHLRGRGRVLRAAAARGSRRCAPAVLRGGELAGDR
jgi:2-isopropylmalate synthase